MQVKPDEPVETSLAFTAAHVKVFTNVIRQGNLPLKSYDSHDATLYREEVLLHLTPHPSFKLDMTPQLLQRWQTDKFEKALAALSYIKRKMESWIEAHGEDPIKQGNHLEAQ